MLKKIINILLLLCCCAWASAQGYRIGDVYTAPDGSKGIVYYLHPDGSGGWVVALKDTSMRTNTMSNSWYEAVNAMDTAHGWELPSWTQLNMLFAQLPFVSSAIINAGGEDLSQGYYWSSDEESENRAYMVSFSNGSLMSAEHKTYPCHVRAVRSFIYPTITSNTPLTYHWNTDSTQAYIIVSPDTTTTYTVTVVDTNGCSGRAELTVVVKQKTYGDTTVVACESFSWHGIEYTETPLEAPTFTIEGGNHNGCDSIVTLNLIVNHKTYGDTTVIACDSFTWHGIEYTETPIEAPTFTIEGGNHNGCDSIVTLNLTVNKSSFSDTIAIACDSLFWHGKFYTETGSYNDTLTNAVGCDSIVTLNLTIKNSTTGIDTKTACDSYTWIDGVTYTESNNTATYTLTNAAGCDSIVTLNLTVNKSSVGDTSATACDIFFWHGNTYTVSGDYYDTLTNAAGCDSVVTLHLTVNYSSGTCVAATDYDGNIYDVIQIGQQCWMKENLRTTHYADGTSIALGSSTSSTTAYRYYPNNNGDNVSTYGYLYNWKAVMGNSVSSDSVPSGVQGICPRGWHVPSNAEWTQLTNYVSSQNEYVCGNNINNIAKALASTTGWNDSPVDCATGNNPSTNNATDFGAMPAGNYEGTPVPLGTFSGYWSATQSNQSNALGRSINIYYSVVNSLNKSKSNAYSVRCLRDYDIPNDTISVCDNQLPYIWNGDTLNEEGTYSVTLQTIHGCDSVVRVHLTINHATNLAVTVDTCDWYTWRGNTYYASGDYMDTLTDSNGCTQVDTLHLTINHATNLAVTVDTCDWYTWRGNTYYASGDYMDTLTDGNGCTQVDTLHLTINHATNIAVTVDTCDWYTWRGNTYYASGDYMDTLTDGNGCIQVDTLHLTINHATNIAVTVDTCDWYTWRGNTYYASGDYMDTLTDGNGCTQVDTLHLTINHATNLAVTVDTCDWYTWRGNTYYASGDYMDTLTDGNGCTQVDTLYLTINHATNLAFSIDTCDWYTWRGNTYYASGDYMDTLTDDNGCTQVDTLHLTINHATNLAVTVDTCDWYTWRGNIYYTSGDYMDTLIDGNGCTQVDTLHLTINHATNLALTVDTCDWYIWRGNTYYASGDYMDTLTDGNGCTQVDTLHLTIYSLPFVPTLSVSDNTSCTSTNGSITVTAPIGEGYTYIINNGTPQTSNIFTTLIAGNYTVTVIDNNGCSSSDTTSITTIGSTVTASASSNTPCVNDTLNLVVTTNSEDASFSWSGPENFSSSEQNPIITPVSANNAGTYTVTVTETATGCSTNTTVNATIKEPVYHEFEDWACVAYTWNDSTYETSDDYIQTFTAANGCDSVVTLHLTIYSLPNISITGNDTICYGDSTELVASESISYSWNTTAHTQSIFVNTTGTYIVTVTDEHNCSNSDTMNVTVRDAVTIATATQSVCPSAGETIVSAQFSNVVSDHSSVTWNANNSAVVHTDVITSLNNIDTCIVEIPQNLCNDSLFYTIEYSDGICTATDTQFIHVVDTIVPLITGTLADLSVSGCSMEDIPTAYNSALLINSLENISISDNCTNLNNLLLSYADSIISSSCDISVLRTYTLTDACGNSTELSQNILINRPSTFSISSVDTARTVYCETMASADSIILPVVKDACDSVLLPSGEPVVNTQINHCNGTKTYTYTYRNCAGNDTTWSFTYTIEAPSITVPEPDTVNISCLSDTVNHPIHAPVLVNACLDTAIIINITQNSTVGTDNTGDIIHTYTYMLCQESYSWTHVYHLNPDAFDPREDSVKNVFCVNDIQEPITPAINACNIPIPFYQDSISSTILNGCGDSTYHYHYTVNGTTYTWSYTYHVVPEDFSITVENGRDTVHCLSMAVAPTSIPTVTNNCGTSISHGEPSIDTTMTNCEGTVTYTYTFTDCAGHSHEWTYTHVISLPALTVPENGTSIITCADMASEPIADTLTDACGREVTATAATGNPIVDVAANGHGTVTYNYTYTDCTGREYPWQFVYTVTPVAFTPVADADTNVHCVADIHTPTIPTISVCNQDIPFTLTSSTFDNSNGCGDSIYVFSYTVNDTTRTWTYTYHIVPEDFTITAANGETTVLCRTAVSSDSITMPVVTDACGNTLTTGNVTIDSTGFNGCQGNIIYNYPYTDCAGNTHPWTFTFHIELPNIIASVPADGSATMACLVDVVRPAADTVTDVCGNSIVPVFVDSTADIHSNGTGSVVFRYRYTDCAEHDSIWTFTYTLNPDSFTPTANDTADVHCISEIHTPTLPVIPNCGTNVPLEEGINTGNITDGCGDTTFVYNYRVNGTDYSWSYTYHVVPEDFEIPSDSSVRVQCITEVVKPTPPVVENNCGIIITPIEQNVDSSFNGCYGHVTYSWLYNDCTNEHPHVWSFTYTIQDTIAPSFSVPADISICKNIDGRFDTDTSITGGPYNLYDNCLAIAELTVAYSDSSTSLIGQRDTIYRTWTVSDHCQSTSLIQHIYLNAVITVHLFDTLCEGELYDSHGFHIVAAMDTVAEHTELSTITRCDSVTTLHLTVNHPIATGFEIDTCDFYTWNGQVYDHSDNYTEHFQTIHGCDSAVTMFLTIYHSTDTTLNVSVNENDLPYILNGNEYYNANTYIQTIPNAHDCDSVITLVLSVNGNVTNSIDSTICENDLPLVWNNVTFYEAGDSSVTLHTSTGADSVLTMHVHVTITDIVQLFDTICFGEIFDTLGFYIMTDTDTVAYRTDLSSITNCDSVTILYLTIKDTALIYLFDDVCRNNAYTENGFNITAEETNTPGELVRINNGTGANNCDSTTILHLTVKDTVLRHIFDETCCHNAYTENGFNVTAEETSTSGELVRINNETAANNCDSTIILHLTVKDTVLRYIFDEICINTEYTENGFNVTAEETSTSGELVRINNGTSANDCDSTTILHLNVKDTILRHIFDNVCRNNAYSENGFNVTANEANTPGATITKVNNGTSANNCDSTTILHLTVKDTVLRHIFDDICRNNAYSENGFNVTANETSTPGATITKVNNGTAANDCDSTTILHLTVKDTILRHIYDATCINTEYNDNGFNVTAEETSTSGELVKINNGTGTNDCDSTTILHLNIKDTTLRHIFDAVCVNTEYNDNGFNVMAEETSTPGITITKINNGTGVNNCDSTTILHLTITSPVNEAFSEYACHPYEWNGQYYSSAGTYTFAHEDANGCEQVDTLHLNYITDTTTTLFSHTFNFCDQEQAVLEVSSSLPNIEWSTGETSPIITVFESGTYFVTASQGQCVINREYTIKPCEYKIHLPNAFTANGDGLNDVFCIPEGYLEQIDDNDFEVYIYDRWGEIVFFSNRKDFRWNGEIKGRVLKNYTYTYLIKYVSASGIPGMIRGSVIVL